MLLLASLCNEFNLLFSLVKSRCLYPGFFCQQGGESQKAVATEGTGIDWEGKKGDQCICVCAPILKAYFVIGHMIS